MERSQKLFRMENMKSLQSQNSCSLHHWRSNTYDEGHEQHDEQVHRLSTRKSLSAVDELWGPSQTLSCRNSALQDSISSGRSTSDQTSGFKRGREKERDRFPASSDTLDSFSAQSSKQRHSSLGAPTVECSNPSLLSLLSNLGVHFWTPPSLLLLRNALPCRFFFRYASIHADDNSVNTDSTCHTSAEEEGFCGHPPTITIDLIVDLTTPCSHPHCAILARTSSPVLRKVRTHSGGSCRARAPAWVQRQLLRVLAPHALAAHAAVSMCLIGGLGVRGQGSGLRAQGSGLRVQGSGFRAQGSGLR
eukprot:877335-Rhodomonas_salina.1